MRKKMLAFFSGKTLRDVTNTLGVDMARKWYGLFVVFAVACVTMLMPIQKAEAHRYAVWLYGDPAYGQLLQYQGTNGEAGGTAMMVHPEHWPSWFNSVWMNGSTVDQAELLATIYNHASYFRFYTDSGQEVWGYVVSDSDPGDVPWPGPVIDVYLLPEGFASGGILTGTQLNTALGAADFNGNAGDVPPAPSLEPVGTPVDIGNDGLELW